MFKVGEANRSSHRFSKTYLQKSIKTEGSRESLNSSRAKKRNVSGKKISGFLLLDELKKTMTKKSKFRDTSESNNFFDRIKEELPCHL